MAPIDRPSRTTRSAGFTLVELLVVIGIIIVLIGILLPVVSSARKAAYSTASANQIKNIGNAIDRYYQDFSAYPGLFSNAAITAGVSLTNGSGNLTMTENCVLSLMGGATPTPPIPYAAPAVASTYLATDIGRGALSFNAVQQKRYSSYLDASPQILSTNGSSLDPATYFGNGAGITDFGVNSGVPEFLDQFPGAMPIIYLRAKVGALGTGADLGKCCDNGTDTTQYDYAQMAPYIKTTTTTVFAPNSSQFPTTANLTTTVQVYFGNASLTTSATGQVPKRKDTYMLISAGKDRIYGTADDICNFDLQ